MKRFMQPRVAFTLAEVFLPHSKGQRKIAFTLAEVLITLGIIGVVAAITMPTLIQNYKKTVYVNQLKKYVSILEQGFQKMLADDGVDSLADTTVFRSINGSCRAVNTDAANCEKFFENLQKYFKIVDIGKIGNYQYLPLKKGSLPVSLEDGTRIVLSDGAFLYRYYFSSAEQLSSYTCEQIKAAGGKMCSNMGFIAIDVNGSKGPNVVGRDVFLFYLSGYGKLVPQWSDDDVIFQELSTSKAWYNNPAACGTPGKADAHEKASGTACAARIIGNGWKMDY